MNDHQDSESFMGLRDEKVIRIMLDKAERKQNIHFTKMQFGNRKERIYHMRNYKALEGGIKSLRWVLGDKRIENPLE
tara:strand:- start:1523 stop:1753 length:231 start_codon:yes stop_codon:yes gene_type:complete